MMTPRLAAADLARYCELLFRWGGVFALLVTVPLLLYAHGIAEGFMATVDLCFVAHCLLMRRWRWLGRGWVPFALAWWGWLVVCSLPVPAVGLGPGGGRSLLQAVLTVRFVVFAVALEDLVLEDARARRWLGWANTAATLWIVSQTVLQLATGANLGGYRRGGDGELTGPFSKPMAGPLLSRMMFPALLPAVWRSPAARPISSRLLAAGGLVGGIAVIVLIGQRMPLLLTGLGMLVTAVFLPRLRLAVAAGLVAAMALIAASGMLFPPTYHRLVLKFALQMGHFPQSPYGVIYSRALAMAVQHPVFGRGFDGYRTGCPLPRYWHGWPQNPASTIGASPDVCVQHPHNFYLQALTDGGVPGLLLYMAMILRWLMALSRGLWQQPDPRRVGLFAAVFISLWPFASTSAFTSMPTGGLFFLLLGWGLAEAKATVPLQRKPDTRL